MDSYNMIKNNENNNINQFMKSGFRISSDDKYYSILYVDDDFCSMTGYTKDELEQICKGRLVNLIHPADLNCVLGKMKECFHKDEKFLCKYRIIKKDGTIIWVRDSGIRLIDEKGNSVIKSVIADISETEMARLERDITFENIPGGVNKILITENDFTILGGSSSFYNMLGTNQEEYKLREKTFIFPEDLIVVRKHILNVAQTNKEIDIGFRVRSSETGETIWYRMVGRYIDENSCGKIYLNILIDITERKTAQMELAREKERYRIALEHSDDILFELDLSLNHLKVYKSNHFDGALLENGEYENWIETFEQNGYIHPADIEKMKKLNKFPTFNDMEIRILTEEDNRKFYRWYALRSSLVCENAIPVRMVGVIRNIDELVKIKEKNEQLQTIFNVELVKDYESIIKINTINRTFTRFAAENKYKFNQINTSDYDTMVRYVADHFLMDDEKEFYFETLKLSSMVHYLNTERPEGLKYFKMFHKNEYRWRSYRFSYLGCNTNCIIVSVKDVHDIRMEQQKQEEANRKLLYDALISAEEANKVKTDFLSMISHEIRSPINMINKMIELSLSNIGDQDMLNEYISKIQSSSSYLLQLINNMLDMSQIESGRLDIHNDKFDLRKVIGEANNIVNMTIQDKAINYRIMLDETLDVYYIGDSTRISQVLTNMLSNAVKFTPQVGNIQLNIKNSGDKEHPVLEFKVQDDGIGISEENLGRIFEVFEKGEKGKWEPVNGTGLGLPICKHLVKLMGGTIDVQSAVGIGSAFTIQIPVGPVDTLAELKKSEEKKENTKSYDFQGAKFLVADDNEVNSNIAKSLLEMRNAKVNCAKNGKEAVEMFAKSDENEYKAILISLQLPVMDGLEATSIIRGMDRKDAKKVPVIAMTANTFLEDIKNSLKSGVNAHIGKPLDVGRLYQILDAYLVQ